MTRPLCDACNHAPGGIEGHAALFRDTSERAASAGNPAAIFGCRHCGAQWWRSYVGDGLFLWHLYAQADAGEPPREKYG